MKIFFRVLLLSLLAFALLNGAESNSEKMFQTGGANFIDELSNLLSKTILDVMQKIYNNVSNILHNKVVYTIFATAIMLWCLNQLKNGYPTRDELWKFGKMVVLCSFILGIFSSYSVFIGFLEYMTIPASWVVSALNGVFSSSGDTLSNQVLTLANDICRISYVSFQKSFNHFDTWGIPDEFEKIFLAVYMLPTWIMAGLGLLLAGCLIAIILFSKFMATLLLCFAPIVVPFLGLPFLKQYFYSWLKLWITYTLIAPIAMLILSISTQTINKLGGYTDEQLGDIVIKGNQWDTYATPIITSIMCLYLLKKIPTWIEQILGVQGAESSGLGAGAAISSAVGSAAGAGMMAKALGQGGFASTFAKNLPGATTARALGAGATKALGNAGGAIGSGMQGAGGIAQALSGGNGIMASAGKTLSQMGSSTRDLSRSMRRSGEAQRASIIGEMNK